MTRQGLVRAPGRVLVRELAGERQDAGFHFRMCAFVISHEQPRPGAT